MATIFAEGKSVTKPPLYEGADYMYWAEHMKLFIKSRSLEVWQVIEEGDYEVKTSDGKKKPVSIMSKEEKQIWQLNEIAKLLLICALPKEVYQKVKKCTSAKEIWDSLPKATLEDSSSEEEVADHSSKKDSCMHEADKALMANLSEVSSEATESDKEVEVSLKHEKLLCDMHDELMKLKLKYDAIKIKLHEAETKMTCYANEMKLYELKIKELTSSCEGKDYEMRFYKDEVERLNLKLAEKPYSPPPYEKLISSSQVGHKGLGFVSKDKGKKVLNENPSLESKEKMKKQLDAKFCRANISYENEMNVVCKHVHVEKKYVKQPKINKHAYVKRSKTFYYKHAPANPHGPKKIWVPKKFMLPMTEAHRKAWHAGVGIKFWVVASHEEEQFLVPRLYLN